ncbi:type VI secretion system Vgr family protein [Pseudomonas fluorescens]|uniref:Gp5/Type VI secretion system Vgr protein OB-fold domain-containing protein n=1 Tax=Pseudomonas fluorescens TaxID=294 RepID=A0A5E7FG76_PSEFL|nr:type VI secretion system tip protein TssI/VgrG [Pseudomonas fluorescens]VVO37924.1 hypothetical protein PS723_05541 [Pseudomonas fluorescens]
MHKDLQPPITLTSCEGSWSLQVTRFTGREALNEPFRFDMELVDRNPGTDLEPLLQQSAFLRLGDDSGIHGIIQRAGRHHLGSLQTGYSLTLAPYLQVLEQRTCRRVFHDLSVPLILRQLLEEHRLPVGSYRFELPYGQYPLRPFCIQFDESDLYFLQRLCEEEGIHYHFEHETDRHVLVFADDSEGFVQLPVATPYRPPAEQQPGQPTISQLSEWHVAEVAQPTRFHSPILSFDTPVADQSATHLAHGQMYGPANRLAPDQMHTSQRGRRALERLRSQHRHIVGHSDQPRLHSGQILQVLGHPMSQFNDQWLLSEVHHQWQQPALKPETSQPCGWQVAEGSRDEHLANPATAPLPEGYRNQFKAIPWCVAFRPALKHPKPCMPGYERGWVAGSHGQPAAQDAQGRIKVRLAWARQDSHDPHSGLWMPLAYHPFSGHADQSRLPMAGSEVLVSFIDSDPDQPIVWPCAGNLALSAPAADPAAALPGIYLNGQRLAEQTRRVQVEPGQTLQVQHSQALTLTANGNRLHLSPSNITLSGTLFDLKGPGQDLPPAPEPTPAEPELWNADIYLYERPPASDQRLPETQWYIVRMPRPGLQDLASLSRDDILMEGKSQHLGSLDLNPEQKRQLALEFIRTPNQLCLLYPGQCVALAEYLQHHWTTEQRQAFMSTGTVSMAHTAGIESSLFFDWLVNGKDRWR